MKLATDVRDPAAGAQPQPTPQPASAPATMPFLLCALASAGLLYLSHFPVGWGWLAWVALVPLLALVRSPLGNGRAFLVAWLVGFAFYIPVLQWLRVADPRMYYTWVGLSLYKSFYVALGVLLVRGLHRGARAPLVLAVPVVWTTLEFVRAYLMGGFPWYFLAHTQHDFLPFIQLADITGAFGLTFILAAANAVVFEWFARLPAVQRCIEPEPAALAPSRPRLAFQSVVVLLAFAGCLFYGSVRMAQAEFRQGPRLALVQSNMEQGVRNAVSAGDRSALARVSEQYATLSKLAADQHTDLIVWPETSYDEEWDVVEADRPASSWLKDRKEWGRKEAAKVAAGSQTDVLLGLSVAIWGPNGERIRRHNSALLIRGDGTVAGRYDKMHRVPFGEYVPLRDTIPWLNKFAPYDYDYSIAAGAEQVRLTVGAYRFGVLICYEDTDPELARRYVDPSAETRAEFLVNISNDGWFGGTAEHEEHLAISRFRAIEARRSLVRSVNMGISAVIDGNGRVLLPERVPEHRPEGVIWDATEARTELPVARWHEFKQIAGVLVARVPIDDRTSLYARWGDWFAVLCSISVVGLLVLGRCRRHA